MWPSASFTLNSTIATSSGPTPSGASLGCTLVHPLTAQSRARYQAISPSVPEGRTTRILADVTGNGKLR